MLGEALPSGILSGATLLTSWAAWDELYQWSGLVTAPRSRFSAWVASARLGGACAQLLLLDVYAEFCWVSTEKRAWEIAVHQTLRGDDLCALPKCSGTGGAMFIVGVEDRADSLADRLGKLLVFLSSRKALRIRQVSLDHKARARSVFCMA